MQSHTATAPPRRLSPAVARDYRPELVTERRHAGVHEIVMGFVAWMREQDLCAWMSSDDLGLALAWYCAEQRIELPPPNLFNGALAKAPGTETARRRLASFATARASLRALAIRAKPDRAVNRLVIYRIMSVDEIAASRPVASRRRPPAEQRLAA